MQELSTEEKIKQAASRIFVLKGLEGARMQDIADAAGINKAMLHYYFRNKQLLFDLILSETILKVFSAFSVWLQPDLDLKTKVARFVDMETDIISEFPTLPLFVLSEFRKNPDALTKRMGHLPINELRIQFKKMLSDEINNGNIRNTTMEEILLNTVSLTVYPVIASPVFQHILGLDAQKYQELLNNRKTMISDLLIKDLQIKKS